MSLLCKVWTHDWEYVTDPVTRKLTGTRACLRCKRVEVLLDYTFGESSWVTRDAAQAAIQRRFDRQDEARRITAVKSSPPNPEA